MARTRHSRDGRTRDFAWKTLRIVLAAALLTGLAAIGQPQGAWGSTTGTVNKKILVTYGSGDTISTWNENVLTVDGKWAYCVQVDSHFEAGLSVTATDPVATGVWSQELCTRLALIDDFVQSGQFMSTGMHGKARHKVTDRADKYAVAQCYIWKALDDAGYSDYDWFGVTVGGEGLTGNDTDAHVSAYIRENKDDYIGHASYYNCGSAQNLACDFSLEPAKGRLQLVKASSDAAFVEGNGEYSLAGAVYGVFESETCKGEPVARLVTDDGGKATSSPLRRGDYFVRELEASPGYELDGSVYPVTVVANETTVVNASSGNVPETPQSGAVQLEKTSSIPDITDGNPCYTNAGAVYGVYADKNCETEIARMTTGEDGRAVAKGLPLGVKYVKELAAPEGMAVDGTVHSVVVKSGETAQVDGGNVTDVPKSCPVELLLSKYDVQLGDRLDANAAQGSATLEGAQFSVEYYAGYYETAREARDSGAPQRSWTFKTDAQGRIALDASHLVSGDALYRDSHGSPCLPLGTVVIAETKPPAGYLANAENFCIQITDDGGSGESVDAYRAPSVPENVKRGDLELVKVGGTGMERLSGVPLRITSQTTGESHIIATDANGYASTAASWNPHTSKTNANDDVHWNEDESGQNGSDPNTGEQNDGTDESEAATEETQAVSPYDCEAGIWFGYAGESHEAIPADDGLGALPFDTYTIEELPCPANRGLQLVRASVVVSKDDTVVDMGTIDDPVASLRTEASDASDGDSTVSCAEDARIVDKVSYANLIPGREYTVNGVIMDKGEGKPVFDERGTVIASGVAFTPSAPDGTVEVSFDLSTATLGGKELVIFEELSEGDRVLASHADLDDADQTLAVLPPAIGTSARDGADGDGFVAACGTAVVVDAVSYSGLVPGREYTLNGSLVDGETGNAALAGESPISAEVSFTPEASAGTVEVTFEFDASSFSAGTRLVAFERLATGGTVVATHEDVDDAGQTICIAEPGIQTTLVDGADGDKTAALGGQVELVDTIAFSGLTAGESYTVRGMLVDKESGKPLEDPEGKAVASQASFVPDSPSGTAEVRFAFDASRYGDREVVAFETLEREEEEIAVHADLEDEAQTVLVAKPRISTRAANAKTQGKDLEANSPVEVVDEVEIAGVQPGREYTLVGVMMDKQTGLPLLCAGSGGQAATNGAGTDADATELAELWAELQAAAGLSPSNGEEDGTIAFDGATQIDYEAAGAALQKHSELVERLPMQITVIAPEASSLTVEVPFSFPTDGISGQTVVFEALVENGTGKLVAVHADIDDENQTLAIPQPISTPENNHTESGSGGPYDKTGNWLDGRIWPFALLAALGCLLAAYGIARSGMAKGPEPNTARWKRR